MLDRIRNFKPAQHAVSASLFLRLLGGIYLIAFTSLWTQIDGLVGSRGIIPFADLGRLAKANGFDLGFWQIPTLCWLDPSDTFLHLLCGAGAALSIVAIVTPLSALLWFLLWAAYFSLFGAGQDFLGFQWDILLLETGFLAVFLTPMTLLPATRKLHVPSGMSLLLLWWLLFRLMFASGLVKITWGDPSWQLNDLTALTYHYETQCIPSWTAWYMHKLPAWAQQLSCCAMYFVEIVGSTFFFLGRRLRRVGCGLQILLQLVILATGNYGFFNYLTLALCVPLLDDAVWPERLQRASEAGEKPRARRWPTWILVPIGACVFLSSLVVFVAGLLPRPTERPGLIAAAMETALEWTAPLQRVHLVNSYGLFRSMTKARPEIVIEGSDDGRDWKAYEFKYKPGDVARRPVFVAPHQPRLDWQMWFEALRPRAASRWFAGLLARLLEGSPPVLRLLEFNPFPEKPPRFLRALRYDYKLTSFDERQATGAWWKRTQRDIYVPPVTLESLRRH